ncbi:hypothetical protein C1O66_17190 [Paucibacter aquatile]|uniref:Lipoprotein n=1 Tax=Kinneretia aquatilis TaxID=2070761 RepID=A0A2N8L057_9BURK|nr:hypothetical protein [Paucibacter aquatile]PND39088.1 hypothetical protein C1O66_17190 [Paucibacter aquatile]
MRSSRFQKTTALLLSLTLLSGCMTRKLWRPDQAPHYNESVSSVLIAKDQKHVVFIGKQYHDVFQEIPGLAELIRSRLAARMLWSQNSDCKYEPDQTVRCTIGLSVVLRNAEDEKEGARIGLKPDSQIQLSFVGKRYAPVPVPADEITPLHNTYNISVWGKDVADRSAGKLLKSPVTVAGDGVLLLVGVPLLVIGKVLGGGGSWR